MNANEYQQLAKRTLLDEPDKTYTGQETMLVWNAIGLTGEAGEVADIVKKGVFHNHGIDRDAITKELGDVLWYVAGIASTLGLNLDEIMERNIAKLKARYPNGYTSSESINRVEYKK